MPTRTGTSLAVLAAVAAAAVAQAPPSGAPAPTPVPGADPTVPAPVQWNPYPALPPVSVQPGSLPPTPGPLPRVATADGPAPESRAPVQGRVVIFQKPAGSDAPVDATPAPASAGTSLPPVTDLPPVPGATGPATRTPTRSMPVARQAPKGQPPAAEADGKPDASGRSKVDPETKKADPTLTSESFRSLTRDRAFQMQSEPLVKRRILDELIEEEKQRKKEDKEKPQSPEDLAAYYHAPDSKSLVPEGTPYQPKTVMYPPIQGRIEPGFVVHRRLLFEDRNTERYGWDLGYVQPVVSALYFYKDFLLWPAHLASNPRERFDTSAGLCPPGDPVPYYLYPPEIDLFGATLGAGAIVGVALIAP
ncbi:hypothetical protein [Fimbriiglobus ruber]|uniref:Outer membrane protein, OmpA/MotB family n=1 Tax=Fimbriiglobus ruber TaxID=1908690 RepID=A0A225DRA6_9BACT|nr:hypothetical protein [Fimbriiglobus ruber]OWK43932.1 Outer membrane protein, OmpA/MotB family [Fimbriiglobus ruber]